ncbi:MAG: hypothetical protein EZS28_025388, partial [Streblomastix strix]
FKKINKSTLGVQGQGIITQYGTGEWGIQRANQGPDYTSTADPNAKGQEGAFPHQGQNQQTQQKVYQQGYHQVVGNHYYTGWKDAPGQIQKNIQGLGSGVPPTNLIPSDQLYNTIYDKEYKYEQKGIVGSFQSSPALGY